MTGRDKWPDLAGCIEGDAHHLPLRVYYEDTDFSGIVYHAAYIKWCERGRTDFVRLIGLNQKELHDGGAEKPVQFFVVRRMEIDYLKPALMDDVLEVVTRVSEIGTATVELYQEIRREDTLLFKAKVMIVLINDKGRPQRLTSEILQAFTKRCSDS